MKEKMVFPRIMYHHKKAPEGQVFHSEEQFKEHGPGWVNSPAHFEKAPKSEEPKAEKVEEAPEAQEMSEEQLMEELMKAGTPKKMLKGKSKEELLAMLMKDDE